MSFLRLARALPRQALAVPCRQAALTLPRRQAQLPFRAYSAGGGLSTEVIQGRIFDLLKGFEKVDHEKVTPTASFMGDLGLDSLDVVEVQMAIEEDFSIEIPDAEADEIQTVAHGTSCFAHSSSPPSLSSRQLSSTLKTHLPVCGVSLCPGFALTLFCSSVIWC
ncbi:hypothetical protein C8R45DRAFT_806597 [Mycena sanguinolenta]|nr:hypothetical protein C8R45DRAFT_806597 [Mycena sanguinolenta]